MDGQLSRPPCGLTPADRIQEGLVLLVDDEG